MCILPLRMKKGLHPDDYRTVVFEDINTGDQFLNKSTAKTKESVKYKDGNEYPLVKIHISSASHPFYTGEEKIVDVEGRVDRFKSQQEAAKKRADSRGSKAKKAAKVAKAKDEYFEEAQKIGAGTTQTKKPKADKKPKAKAEKKPEVKVKKPAEKEENPVEPSDKSDDK